MKIYEVRPDINNFQCLDGEKLLTTKEFDGTEIMNWKPLTLEWQNLRLPLGDFVGMGGSAFILNDKMKAKLFNSDIHDIQYLPICKPENYEVMNILKVVDAIDYEQAIPRLFSTGRLMMFTKYAFKQELLTDVYLFKIPELTRRTFATDRFKTFIERNEFTGIKFIEVWNSNEQNQRNKK